MRKISPSEITSKVKELCIRAACELGSDVIFALEGFRGKEESPLGKEVLDQIIENAQIALKEDAPMCQDTGIAVFFVEVGRNAAIDGSLEDAINEGVRQGYKDGYLRKSVCDPITRKNTDNNSAKRRREREYEQACDVKTFSGITGYKGFCGKHSQRGRRQPVSADYSGYRHRREFLNKHNPCKRGTVKKYRNT